MLAKSLMFWNVLDIPFSATLLGLSPAITLSLKVMEPDVGAYIPVTQLKNVVFPAPLGPIRLTISLSSTWKSTFERAVRPPKERVRFFTSSKDMGYMYNKKQPVKAS